MKNSITILAILFMVSGCSFFREQAKVGCEEMALNAEAIRELGICILKNWLPHSGLIREALGAKMDELPVEVVKAMDELDKQAMRYAKNPDDFTGMELGGTVGKKSRLLWAVVVKALETYAPDVLQYVTILI